MNKENSSQNEIVFDYYELTLLKYLQEFFPEKAGDISFIKERAAMAAQAESSALLQGCTPQGAEEASYQVMYEGLHFSPYATVLDILMDISGHTAEENLIKSKARELTTECAPLFGKYQINDEFVSTPEYDMLCDELKFKINGLLTADGL